MVVGSIVAGRYRIVRPLGEGGMGQVYEAVLVGLERRVAMKTLLPEFAQDPALLARFRREAESAAALGHPNIVGVNDFVAEPGQPPFLVMELLEGVTLRDVIEREGKLAPARAAFIGAQILSGLGAAHRAGIIHRDVKPANVFLQSTIAMKDIVKLVDFGLAKLVIDATKTMPGVTKNGQVLGTLAYMSPEQASGAPTDHRADIWAVGATLFHCLSGFRPMEVVELGKKTSVATVAPWLNAGLAAVIDRALERDPLLRWSSAEEMAAALAPYASQGQIEGPGSAPRMSYDATVVPTMGTDPSRSYSYPSTAYASSPSAAPLPAPPPLPATWQSAPPPAYGPTPPPPMFAQPAPPAPQAFPMKLVVGIIAAVLAVTIIVPIATIAISTYRVKTMTSGVMVNAEQNFVANAKFPTCPSPDRCTEQMEDHGVTYPVCTNKMPKENPPRYLDYVLVRDGDNLRIAFIGTQPTGNDRYDVRYMISRSDEAEIKRSDIAGRLCRPGSSVPRY